MESEILKEFLRMDLQFSLAQEITRENNEVRTKLSNEDLKEIVQVLNDRTIGSIYDCLSIDKHELIWSKHGVHVYDAVGYYYADILGLDGDDFMKLEQMLEEVKQ